MFENAQALSGLSVLAVFAHPDDEGFGCGGTLAMLVARGAKVTLVCATNGDVGEISDPNLATTETLAQVRREELHRAMAITGVKDLHFLGYRDSGMSGTPHNSHPESLHQAQPDKVVGELVSIIRELRPEAVITHDPTGGYGHPDHLAVHRHVTHAFALAGDAAAYLEQPGHRPVLSPSTSLRIDSVEGQPTWTPRLLYYVCFPRSNFRKMWQRMLDLGITPPFASMDINSLGSPDAAVTTVLDVSKHLDTKIASLRCHRTQIRPDGPFAQLPPEVMREIMSTEYFALVHPEGAGKEADLLARL